MAEEKNKPKRLLKNPETFREKAAKAQSKEPNKKGIVRRGFIWLFSKLAILFRPLKKLVIKFKKTRVAKFLKKPLKFLAKILFLTYIAQSFHELKKVTWPKWKQSRSLTVAVLIFAIVFGALIASVDYGLDKLFRSILLK